MDQLPGAGSQPMPDEQPVDLARRFADAMREGISFVEAVERNYDALRRKAHHLMAKRFGPLFAGATRDPTELVHDALLRLRGQTQPLRTAQYALHVTAMLLRWVFTDYLRGRREVGDNLPDVAAESAPEDVSESVQKALGKLMEANAALANVVVLYYYLNLSMSEVAEELGVSLATAERMKKDAKQFIKTQVAEAA